MEKSRLIAEVLDVTLDELVNYEGGETAPAVSAEGKACVWNGEGR